MPITLTDTAFTEFLSAYPEFESTRTLDDLRAQDYARLDAGDHVYLDYTGGGLYAESQVRDHAALLSRGVFGNPHSTNPTSQAATELVERARHAILRYFNASPDEYIAAFTLNASGALKLVGEAYPFEPGDHYVLTFDNHNSVNGIREFARAKGATVTYVPVTLPDMRVAEADLDAALHQAQPGGHNLFAFPAQSNFSGVQHSLAWIERAHALGWDVLLDAAAFVPTNHLDVSRWKPDFMDVSFYKMFGYPTGVGCLIARKAALAKLRRPWFAGGTITVASVQGDRYYLAEGEAAFEDGTINYLTVPAIEIGLRHLETVGLDLVHKRVGCLTGWLLDHLLAFRHSNGKPLVRLYGPPTTAQRGGTITVNFYNAAGHVINHHQIEKQANARNISLRTGCFCNPGGAEVAMGITGTELSACFRQLTPTARLTADDFQMCIDGKSTGAVRVSLGLVSNFADVQKFLAFAGGLLNE